MRKLNYLMICLAFFFFAISCSADDSENLTLTPVPSEVPTIVPTDDSLITTTGSFFALSVADVEASAEWYSEKFGLEITMQIPNAGQPTVIVLEGGGLIVELVQQGDALPLNEVAPAIQDKTLIHGIFKVGIIVQDFDKTIEILQERNVTIAFGPFPATAEQRANVIITDNEGNMIQLFGE